MTTHILKHLIEANPSIVLDALRAGGYTDPVVIVAVLDVDTTGSSQTVLVRMRIADRDCPLITVYLRMRNGHLIAEY